jgi:hypothetical protein
MVSNKRFVTTWMEASNTGWSTKDVAKKLALKRQAVLSRAAWLRKRGVKLPALVRTPELDTDALNSLIDALKQ